MFDLQVFQKLKAYLYDVLISHLLTITAHLLMTSHMTELSGNFLDVGCGTGASLQAIIPYLKLQFSKVIGIDIHHEYALQAQNRFKDEKDVTIH
jgi:ubiquinone/menaquinone biosynthesis C-methylase UbiE